MYWTIDVSAGCPWGYSFCVKAETVARALGHASSRTTARYYTELTPETTINEVKQALALATS